VHEQLALTPLRIEVARPQSQPYKLVLSSSSQQNDLGRVRRVKAKPLRGRFASFDTVARPEGWQRSRRMGEKQGTGSVAVGPKFAGPLASAKRGLSRSLTDSPLCRSGPKGARTGQIPKLIVQVAKIGLAAEGMQNRLPSDPAAVGFGGGAWAGQRRGRCPRTGPQR
jgi:hypothetical protein